jgi:phosphatidylserine decarboxylase
MERGKSGSLHQEPAKKTTRGLNTMSYKYRWPDPPSDTAFPIARPGWPIIFGAVFVTFVLALSGFGVAALIAMAATLFICCFFRDPDRVTPDEERAVICPADGKVVFTGIVESNPFLPGRRLKVGIFMSVFNVHVNRVPLSGKIEHIAYYPGKFMPADRPAASTKNEHNAVTLETGAGEHICFVQVAGLIARRIICNVKAGDLVTAGQRFGMICFGSRVDVYLPADAMLQVRIGDKVTAGTTILGYMESPIDK